MEKNSLLVEVLPASSVTVQKTHHGLTIERHRHEFYEFVYVEQGFAVHNCEGITSILTPGDMFAISPNHFHSYIRTKNNIIYNCLFEKQALGSDFAGISMLPGINEGTDSTYNESWNKLHMNPAQGVEIISVLKKMMLEEKEKKTGWKLRMKASLIDFLIIYSRAYEKKYQKNDSMIKNHSDKVFKTLAYLEQNYAASNHIHDLAEEFGIHSDYLSKIFKSSTGLSPTEYLINLRLAKAVEFLNSSDLTIAEISMEVGFTDPAYFTRRFKKAIGVSPSAYKKQVSSK